MKKGFTFQKVNPFFANQTGLVGLTLHLRRVFRNDFSHYFGRIFADFPLSLIFNFRTRCWCRKCNISHYRVICRNIISPISISGFLISTFEFEVCGIITPIVRLFESFKYEFKPKPPIKPKISEAKAVAIFVIRALTARQPTGQSCVKIVPSARRKNLTHRRPSLFVSRFSASVRDIPDRL